MEVAAVVVKRLREVVVKGVLRRRGRVFFVGVALVVKKLTEVVVGIFFNTCGVVMMSVVTW